MQELDFDEDRVLEPKASGKEEIWENKLRPSRFDDFPGQTKIVEKLQVFLTAAKKRGEPLDHVLLCGPPGLGKTTLAHLLAHEMGVEIKTTSGPALDRKGDLAAILTSLSPHSVLFIDEIHRLNRVVEEYLYSAMEDYYVDLVTGEGLGARVMKFQLSPFTLVGATTRAGLLDNPFRDRFGIVERLAFYTKDELAKIIMRSAKLLSVQIDESAALSLSVRSRGTPRIANRLLKRVRDFAEVHNKGMISEGLVNFALDKLEVDQLGLDDMDRKILSLLLHKFEGKPVGIETMAAALSEDKGTIEEVYEPYLIQEGFIQKTPRGRLPTELAKKHLESIGDSI